MTFFIPPENIPAIKCYNKKYLGKWHFCTQ